MEIHLTKKPKNPIIIEGFPGFGLVGTIASEFLIEHLDCENIGSLFIDKIPAMVAIHDGDMIQPMGIYYCKKHNIVFIHGITVVQGLEWTIVDAIIELSKQMKAKEIISLEGIGSTELQNEPKVFFYSNTESNIQKFQKMGLEKMKEGTIMGVTGCMLYKGKKMNTTCFFAETANNMPDSLAAAKVIESLDKYLGLKVDYKPLLKQAEKFEGKIKTIISKGKTAISDKEKKQMSYVG